jgi:hypothetical protein
MYRWAYSALYRCRHLLDNVKAPDVRRRFRIAAARYHSSVPRVAIRVLRLYWRGRLLPEESFVRGLADPAVPISASEEHLCEERLHAMQMSINSPNAANCRDKLLFHAYCVDHGLPVAQVLGLLSARGSRSHGGERLDTEESMLSFVEQQLPGSFIVKPRGGRQGRDVFLMGSCETVDSKAVHALVAELRRLERSGEDWLIEERLRPHDAIARLTGSPSISGMRIVTLISGTSAPEILDAYLRIIVGDSITDNTSGRDNGTYSGNMVGIMDLASGTLVKAWVPDPRGVGYRWTTLHPLTSESIAGFSVPYWSETCALIKSAALRFLPLRTVGWDVAITNQGPVLIEANERYQYSRFGPEAVRLRNALQAEQARLARLGVGPSS